MTFGDGSPVSSGAVHGGDDDSAIRDLVARHLTQYRAVDVQAHRRLVTGVDDLVDVVTVEGTTMASAVLAMVQLR